MRTLAADNPCDQWLTTILTGSYGAGVIGVEPGAHFNRYGSWRYTAAQAPAFHDRSFLCGPSWDSTDYVRTGGHGVIFNTLSTSWCP